MRGMLILAGLPLIGLFTLGRASAAPPPGEVFDNIDTTKDGVFHGGKWEYQFRITGKGSRSEGTHGKLLFDGKEVPDPAGINDRYNTPWGIMFWNGNPKILWGPHGWMLRPVAGKPEGKALADPAGGGPGPAAATSQPASQPEGKTVQIGQESNGKTVSAKTGQNLVVRLKGNATTGYLWAVKSIDGKSVEAVGQVEYKPDAAPVGVVGSPGVFQATFRTIAAGKSTITLIHARPWEKNVAPIDTFRVTVDVQDAATVSPP